MLDWHHFSLRGSACFHLKPRKTKKIQEKPTIQLVKILMSFFPGTVAIPYYPESPKALVIVSVNCSKFLNYFSVYFVLSWFSYHGEHANHCRLYTCCSKTPCFKFLCLSQWSEGFIDLSGLPYPQTNACLVSGGLMFHQYRVVLVMSKQTIGRSGHKKPDQGTPLVHNITAGIHTGIIYSVCPVQQLWSPWQPWKCRLQCMVSIHY